jgi:hypothetical protein
MIYEKITKEHPTEPSASVGFTLYFIKIVTKKL